MSSVSAVRRERQISAKGRRRFTVDALFTDHRPQAVGVDDLPTAKEIRLERIEPDPAQPRRTFDPDRLEELGEHPREGILQPIAVRYDADGHLRDRPWRAPLARRPRGWASPIPAIVRDVPEDAACAAAHGEHRPRRPQRGRPRRGPAGAEDAARRCPWEAVAEMVGIRRSRLFQLLGTEKLPERSRTISAAAG